MLNLFGLYYCALLKKEKKQHSKAATPFYLHHWLRISSRTERWDTFTDSFRYTFQLSPVLHEYLNPSFACLRELFSQWIMDCFLCWLVFFFVFVFSTRKQEWTAVPSILLSDLVSLWPFSRQIWAVFQTYDFKNMYLLVWYGFPMSYMPISSSCMLYIQPFTVPPLIAVYRYIYVGDILYLFTKYIHFLNFCFI